MEGGRMGGRGEWEGRGGCTFTCIHVQVHLYMYMYVCSFTCTCIYMYTCMYCALYIHSIFMYSTDTCIYMYFTEDVFHVHTDVYMYIQCTCICVYMYTHIHIYMYAVHLSELDSCFFLLHPSMSHKVIKYLSYKHRKLTITLLTRTYNPQLLRNCILLQL